MPGLRLRVSRFALGSALARLLPTATWSRAHSVPVRAGSRGQKRCEAALPGSAPNGITAVQKPLAVERRHFPS